jgi:tetratricopeptide (TPR) repeat protein
MNPGTPVQPKLGDLLARYLQRQAEAQEAGLAAFNPGDVTPYDAGPVQPIDPKLAWEEATIGLAAAGKIATPPNWPQLVAAHEPVVALAFAAGNFPQLVRNLHMILHESKLESLRPQAGRPTAAPGLEEWANQAVAKGKFAQAIVALGAMRLAKQFEQAEKFIEQVEGSVPANYRAAWQNEKAALLWHKGEAEKARELWGEQEPSLAVLFNRGMADLFLGDRAGAAQALNQVVQKIPETSAWHHLARLYLTLAQSPATR